MGKNTASTFAWLLSFYREAGCQPCCWLLITGRGARSDIGTMIHPRAKVSHFPSQKACGIICNRSVLKKVVPTVHRRRHAIASKCNQFSPMKTYPQVGFAASCIQIYNSPIITFRQLLQLSLPPQEIMLLFFFLAGRKKALLCINVDKPLQGWNPGTYFQLWQDNWEGIGPEPKATAGPFASLLWSQSAQDHHSCFKTL